MTITTVIPHTYDAESIKVTVCLYKITTLMKSKFKPPFLSTNFSNITIIKFAFNLSKPKHESSHRRYSSYLTARRDAAAASRALGAKYRNELSRTHVDII